MLRALGLKTRLAWQIMRCQDVVLKDYQQALLPTLDGFFCDSTLAVIDLEMTGLNAAHDQILSIGMVPVRSGQLILKAAQHKLVKIAGSVGQSATIHGILDSHLNGALTLEQAMEWFLTSTRGKLLVAHHAPLDLAFLQQGIARLQGEKINLCAIDTLAIEKQRLLRQHAHLQEGALRLGNCRARYGLPVYAAHNALMDAVACGELLLAQVAAMGGADKVRLGALLA